MECVLDGVLERFRLPGGIALGPHSSPRPQKSAAGGDQQRVRGRALGDVALIDVPDDRAAQTFLLDVTPLLEDRLLVVVRNVGAAFRAAGPRETEVRHPSEGVPVPRAERCVQPDDAGVADVVIVRQQISTVGSSVPITPFVMGVVPVVRSVNAVEPTGA